MNKLILILFILFFLPLVSAYCNETVYYQYANVTLDNSTQVNSSTTIRECSPEYNNFSFLIAAIVFLFITALVVVSLIISKKIWLKVCLTVALAICLTSLLRFSSWFISITNPAEVSLIDTLDFFYSLGVRAMYFLIAGSMLFLVVYIINSIRDRPRKREKEDWANWGKDE
jgi:glucan phosphoethanolaminetransferase (alkaline phosphatase superfamily)